MEKVDFRRDERFHMYPTERVQSVAMLTGAIGFFAGFYDGIKTSSLRYLTENSHRLPTNVGGWYFYHKKKNYVMLSSGCKTGVAQSIKYSALVGSFFLTESILDNVRGKIDFLNTTLNSTVFFTTFGYYKKLSRRQVVNYGKRGFLFGLFIGLGQDLMIWSRGGNVWYLQKLGIKPSTTEQTL